MIQPRTSDALIEYSGRIGSGQCRSTCRVCGRSASWPAESIQHSEFCCVPLLEADERSQPNEPTGYRSDEHE